MPRGDLYAARLVAVALLLLTLALGSPRARSAVAQPSGAIVSTLAGSDTPGFAEGPAASAQFLELDGVAVDAAGVVYLASNGGVRTITRDGMVSTLAQTGLKPTGPQGSPQVFVATSVGVDQAGPVYATNSFAGTLWKILQDGTVLNVAGAETAEAGGFADGPAGAALFHSPSGIAPAPAGMVYVADANNNRVRKVAPDGTVTTLGGSGVRGFADGPAASAQFAYPTGVAVDSGGVVYVADQDNSRIRKIAADGTVTTLAGSGVAGYADGPAASAQFRAPYAIAVDTAGAVYVADEADNRIRKIAPDGTVTTLAGSGVRGFADGPADTAQFDSPEGVAVDTAGVVYVADKNNFRVRKIVP
jgi:sugar lactone lactonase YvrE